MRISKLDGFDFNIARDRFGREHVVTAQGFSGICGGRILQKLRKSTIESTGKKKSEWERAKQSGRGETNSKRNKRSRTAVKTKTNGK